VGMGCVAAGRSARCRMTLDDLTPEEREAVNAYLAITGSADFDAAVKAITDVSRSDRLLHGSLFGYGVGVGALLDTHGSLPDGRLLAERIQAGNGLTWDENTPETALETPVSLPGVREVMRSRHVGYARAKAILMELETG
jgi:hypothetical protein